VESIMYDIGAILWEKKPTLLSVHMDHLIAQTQRVLTEMANSSHARFSPKYDEYVERIKQLEEKRRCL